MQSFIRRENLKRYRGLLARTSDEEVRGQLFKLIAEEERCEIFQMISEQEAEARAKAGKRSLQRRSIAQT